MGTALKMKCLSFCAVMLMLVIALVIGAADEPHDLSSLDQRASVEAASPTDDLESLSKEQLLSFFTGQVADLKKQSANQNAAHDEQVADLQKQNAAHEERVAALKARLDGASRLAAAKNDELGEQTMMKTVMQGRFGVGGVLTAGLDAEQNGGFEEKELGEVALVSDPAGTELVGSAPSLPSCTLTGHPSTSLGSCSSDWFAPALQKNVLHTKWATASPTKRVANSRTSVQKRLSMRFRQPRKC